MVSIGVHVTVFALSRSTLKCAIVLMRTLVQGSSAGFVAAASFEFPLLSTMSL